jgi:hypothetical protein
MVLETSRVCENCSQHYRPSRANQDKYCSKKCRRAAMRQRKAEGAPGPSPAAVSATPKPLITKAMRIADARAWLKEREAALDAATQRDDLTDDDRVALCAVLIDQVVVAEVYLQRLVG